MVIHRDWRIVWANPAALTLFGAATADDLIGQSIVNRIHPDSLSMAAARSKLMSESGASLPLVEERLLRLDGTVIEAEVRSTPVEYGGAPAVYTSVHDITDRKRATDALMRANERLTLAQQAAGAGVWDWDMVSGHLSWSLELRRLFGLQASNEASFEVWRAIVHPEDLEAAGAYINDAIRDRIRLNSEYRIVLPSGDVRWIHALGDTTYDDGGQIRSMAGICMDITERRRSEQALRESEARLRSWFQMPIIGICVTSPTKGWLEINDYLCDLLGYTRDELVALTWADLTHPDDLATDTRQFERVMRGEIEGYSLDKRYCRKDGAVINAEVAVRCVRTDTGAVDYFVAFIRDMTDRIRAAEEKGSLEAQLVQAQKMESVGRLAGGVAHDFNNMLSVILGHAELALEHAGAGEPLRDSLLQIRKAAKRSAELTGQLLAFARKQNVAPQVIDLNTTVMGALRMLDRLIGEDILLKWQPGADLWSVKIDPSQVDQILANLCVNARDAIDGVGVVAISTRNYTLSDADCHAHPSVAPGDYVSLAVTDDGCGMDLETVGHIFEPFFTTKPLGEGTGLGLASVYGAVRQNGGIIDVQSAVGVGTTFVIHLPRCAAQVDQTSRDAAAPATLCGHETVLLVEDQQDILDLTTVLLERLGYRVLAAGTPSDAVRLADEHPGPIDLLVTDIVMPEMNGRALATRLLLRRPDLECLFMSGYPADVIARHGVMDPGVSFIQKPFSVGDFGAKVREALDRDSP